MPAELTQEQLEQFTDVMVGKLAFVRAMLDHAEDSSKLYRAEIQQVIADTYVLLSAEDVAAELERWRSAA